MSYTIAEYVVGLFVNGSQDGEKDGFIANRL